MIRKTRRFIFYTFLILFIILAYIVILYSQGYSFDWRKKSLVVTGAFYFKSYPKEADIYINNEYQGKTNKFIKRLLPEEYSVKIFKPGYYEWQKALKVESKLVTEAKNILLIKKNPSVNQITNYNVKHLSFSNDKKKIIYLTDKATKEIDPTKQKVADPREIITYSKFALRLMDLTNNTDAQISFPRIPKLSDLLEISWSPDDKRLLLLFPHNHYYILDLENPSEIIDLNNLIKPVSNYNVKNSLFHSRDSNKIYFLSNNNLFLVDLTDVSLVASLSSGVSSYNLTDNEIFYIQSTDHYLYKMNLDGSIKQKIVEIPKNTQETRLSDDNKKLLWRTKNEIGVIWLEPDLEQPLRKRYEIKIVMKTLKEISQATWYSKTNQHIIFVVEDEIKITELDGRDKRNTANIFSIENPRVFYNKWNGKLYVLSKEQLFEIK